MFRTIEENRGELTRLCAFHKVLRLSLFGSATTDRFDPEQSDLDFLVEFKPMSPEERADHYFGLMEDLQALSGSRSTWSSRHRFATLLSRRRRGNSDLALRCRVISANIFYDIETGLQAAGRIHLGQNLC